MADTLLSAVSNTVQVGGEETDYLKGKTTDATTKAGDIVKYLTAEPDIDPADADYTNWDAAGTNKPVGVLKERSDVKIDTAIADNKDVDVIPLRSGKEAMVHSIDNMNTAIIKGDILYLSDTTPGRFEKDVHVIGTVATPTVNELYALQVNRIGTAMEDKAASAGSVHVRTRLN